MSNILKKNLAWGTSTWRMFHWFSQNINDEFYIKNRAIIHYLISNIISCLPCPTCRGHAIAFMNKHKLQICKNKEQLKHYFFVFHNIVNDRKKVKNPDKSILEKYGKMNGIAVLNHWKKYFNNELGIVIYDFMNKNNIQIAKTKMLQFIYKNRAQFNNL